METIIALGLLAVIAAAEGTRLYLAFKPLSRKQHFKERLKGTRSMIWDLQFKVFKTREIREDIRKQYDQMKSRIAAMEEKLKNWPVGEEADEKKRTEDEKVRAERDAERYAKQMAALDVEVEGSKPNVDMPDGYEGITQKIDSLREVETMIKEYLRDL